MTEIITYRGRAITSEDIRSIRELIAAHPGESRRTLSTKLCEAWAMATGQRQRRDMVCRACCSCCTAPTYIELPPVKFVPHNPLAKRVRPAPVLLDTTPIAVTLRDLQPMEFMLVRRSGEEPLFNSLMEEHHYLGYEQPVGEHLKYLVWANGRPVACVRGRARRVISASAIATSAGTRKRAGATFGSLPTTPGF